ncbi:hypothetical protein [Salinispora arenicola]|uniref:Uncharacterized protein n=1 Tax=Salinispora arenicola (strain CNS-205) TaxID=391037 RepID=A8M142_SALAI|nr:hypothetical protein [Salinispora arenicola]MCN0177311.1 hypothetical protein [Salinispora arenicola]
MTVRAPNAIWQEDTAVLHVVLSGDDGRRPTRTVSLSLLCWVNLDSAGEVCGVDVHDLPPELTDAISNYTGDDIIGRTLVNDGWLWIPLSGNSTQRRHTGVADIDLVLDEEGLAALAVRFERKPH